MVEGSEVPNTGHAERSQSQSLLTHTPHSPAPELQILDKHQEQAGLPKHIRQKPALGENYPRPLRKTPVTCLAAAEENSPPTQTQSGLLQPTVPGERASWGLDQPGQRQHFSPRPQLCDMGCWSWLGR